MADLRRTMDNILKKYGHNILLQRRINEWDGENPEYTKELERHTVRDMHPASRTLLGVTQEGVEGVFHDFDVIYFFRHTANPQVGDRIYENIETFPNGLEVWTIDIARPMRKDRGRIEFWVCGVSKEIPKA